MFVFCKVHWVAPGYEMWYINKAALPCLSSFKRPNFLISLRNSVIPTSEFVAKHTLHLPGSVFFHTLQMWSMMSRDLMNVQVIAMMMAAGVRGSRCVEKLKSCRANIWSLFYTRMSQHDQRNPLDLLQTLCVCVYVCVRGCGMRRREGDVCKLRPWNIEMQHISFLHDSPIPVFKL